MHRKALLLMGPTASCKTELAISLCKRFPFDIVSVDSALVYRGMNIGTAKPDAATLRRTPHRLVDIREPEQSYSAGDFVRDARAAIDEILATGRVPLLVGGTMMYFRALTGGLAELPAADAGIRAALDEDARAAGWPALHARLAEVDPAAAARIAVNDRQRIQRALEVYLASGRSLTEWQENAARSAVADVVKVGLLTASRPVLHERIELRLQRMLEQGFIEEVEGLLARPGLRRDAPAMRAVGYRQLAAYLASECSLDEARYRALVATRQLAKRQITWLRSEPSVSIYDPLEAATIDAISGLACDKIFAA